MAAADAKLILLPTVRGEALLGERSDDELMLLTRAGRHAAFDALVERHQARVLRLAARYLSDASLAPDVAQRAFVELFHSTARYQPAGKFRAYLGRIVTNQCRMAARSEKRHRPAERGPPEQEMTQDEDDLLARERRRELERALAQLSPKLREPVVLRYVADLSLEEIADVLGVPLGTVKSRLFAAMDKLRVTLAGDA